MAARSYDVPALPGDVPQELEGDSNQTHRAAQAVQVEVTWDSPEDPANPLNFSLRCKIISTLVCALAAFNVTFASASPTSASTQIRAQFSVGAEVVELLTTLFLLGFMAGPILWGPGSEVFGRRNILVFTIGAYVLFILGQALAPNIQTLLITRFFSGMFSASPLTTSGGIIGDIWPIERRAIAMSIFSGSIFMGPVLGPVIGSAIIQRGVSWRWIFWVMFFFGCGSIIVIVITLPETYSPILLTRKAKRLRKVNTSPNIQYYGPNDTLDKSFHGIAKRTLFKPFKMIWSEPILSLLTVYLSLVYGLLYGQFQALPIIFGQRGFNAIENGLVFIALGIGTVIGALINVYNCRNYPQLTREWRGFPPPEPRLIGIMIAGPILVVALFWVGWLGAYRVIPWYVPALGLIPLGLAISLSFISVLTYIVDTYAMNSASALAANTIVRSAVAAGFPLFTSQMFNKMRIQWASTLLGCVALLLLPSPFLFYKYGHRLRRRSDYAPAWDLQVAQDKRRENESFARANPPLPAGSQIDPLPILG